ncbi:MAG TPA: DNA mismatch repair protein MutS, partial [bacterium]|nr:DNA mismatch repair protein MutS [bacterium]
TELEDWHFLPEEGKEVLKRILNASTLSGIGVEDKPLALAAFHALYQYLLSTQKRELTYLTRVQFYSQSDFMLLDEASVRNLELVRNLSEGTARASLLEVLDHTVTGMGGRLLKRWILYPLVEKEAVASRAARVDFFFQRQTLMEEARKILKDIHDLERILARVNFGTANARDLVNLKNSLIPLKALSSLLEEEGIRTHEELSLFLGRALLDSPPATLTEGGMIRPDFDERLKELSAAREESEAWIMDLEKRERERTGISSLKVGYTSIFGYYIEVTNSNLKLVPLDYVRKQTLVNSERFVTPELKEKENFILTSEEKKKQMEYGIFQELREKVRKETQILQKTAEKVAALDVLATLAFVAARNGYVRPEISDDETILIEEGRHPVVEKNIREQFTPNDLLLDRAENQILLITGPNMAGKSVYIKQAALITIMAQMGGFVPAGRAKIGIVDRIFTRIGSGENLGKGLSTFMVEMMEVSNILHNATGKSLVIMDEVGRGTSTFDGISIAWACLEYLSLTNNPHAPRILFATHFF